MNSTLLAALIASGATSTTVPSAWREALVAAGAADGQLVTFLKQEGYSGSVADMFFKYLGDKGYVGTLSDRISAAAAASDLFTAPVSYLTWNPADAHADYALSGGDLVVNKAGVNSWVAVRSLLGVQTGTVQVDIGMAYVGTPNVIFGIGTATASLSTYVGGDANGYGWNANSGSKYHSGVGSAYGGSANVGEHMQMVIDLDNRLMYPATNGTVIGTGIDFSSLVGDLYAMVAIYDPSQSVTSNFGATAFDYQISTYSGWAQP